MAALSVGLAACRAGDPGSSARPATGARPRAGAPSGTPVRPSRSARWPDGSAHPPLLGTRFEPSAVVTTFELIAPGAVLVSATSDGAQSGAWRREVELAAPWVGARLEVRGPGDGLVEVGLADLAGDVALRAEAEPATGSVALSLDVGGLTTVLAAGSWPLSAEGFDLGLALCENQATLLVRSADGAWEPVVTSGEQIASLVDLRSPDVLSTLGFVWAVREGAVPVGRAECGVFGWAGLRDPHLVQHADGTPYSEDGFVYLTWTCAGLGFFRQAHWGVFRMDPADPATLEQVGRVFTAREGVVVGDHAGQIVRDGDAWLLLTSSWGTFDGSGVHVRSARVTEDPLRGTHVVRTERVVLPTSLSSWDPSLTRMDGQWFLAFTESPTQSPFEFHPALATTSSADPLASLARVGADVGLRQTEGTLIVRDRDGWKVLASDGDARAYRVYDTAMAELGVINASYPTNIPHPQVLPLPGGRWMMITFDGTTTVEDVVGYGGHGSVVVLRST